MNYQLNRGKDSKGRIAVFLLQRYAQDGSGQLGWAYFLNIFFASAQKYRSLAKLSDVYLLIYGCSSASKSWLLFGILLLLLPGVAILTAKWLDDQARFYGPCGGLNSHWLAINDRTNILQIWFKCSLGA